MRKLENASSRHDDISEPERPENFNFAEAAVLIQDAGGGDDDDVQSDLHEVVESLDDPCELIDFTNYKPANWRSLQLKNPQKSPSFLPQVCFGLDIMLCS
ncbi:unnamed protein product [Gongylonema pulchrum]|uniref:Uncharacterized protein n=1 Tax=Gongylonema pulchrum TaxID=637853 RepID=A0A3P7PRH5_9BILA|nr:unnamed protein product [Gongylonema pulchrum]